MNSKRFILSLTFVISWCHGWRPQMENFLSEASFGGNNFRAKCVTHFAGVIINERSRAKDEEREPVLPPKKKELNNKGVPNVVICRKFYLCQSSIFCSYWSKVRRLKKRIVGLGRDSRLDRKIEEWFEGNKVKCVLLEFNPNDVFTARTYLAIKF